MPFEQRHERVARVFSFLITNGDVPVPEGDGEKALHKKKLVMEKRIIVDLIKDHFIR